MGRTRELPITARKGRLPLSGGIGTIVAEKRRMRPRTSPLRPARAHRMNPAIDPQAAAAALESVSGVRDGDLPRELVVAVIALAAFFFSAPRGRRWLARVPAALLLLAPLPLAVAALFPDSVDGPRLAAYGIRFFMLASIVQSVLLVAVVSVWERIGRPIPKIFLDVLRWLAGAAALLAILFEAGVQAENL